MLQRASYLCRILNSNGILPFTTQFRTSSRNVVRTSIFPRYASTNVSAKFTGELTQSTKQKEYSRPVPGSTTILIVVLE